MISATAWAPLAKYMEEQKRQAEQKQIEENNEQEQQTDSN